MKNVKIKLSLIKSFIARNDEGYKWLMQQYKPYTNKLKKQDE